MLILVLVLMLIYYTQTPYSVRISRTIPWSYAIISMGYILFWASLRSGFVDTSAYIRFFQNAETGLTAAINSFSEGGKMAGYNFIQILFKTIVSSDFHYWLAFIAIATGIPIMTTLRKHSPDYLYSMFLFITSTMVIWMFNGIRQFLVAAIMFGLGYLIQERKMVKYIIAVILCSYIHSTVLFMLPIYFFVTDKPFGKRMLIFLAAVLSCAITIAPLMDSMDAMLQGTSYAANLQQFAEDDGVHPLRVALAFVPVVLAFLKRKTIAAQSNGYINICINMSVISAGLYFVGMFTSGIMIGRLPIFFRLYNLILIPYLINFSYKERKELMYTIFSVVYIVFYYLMGQNYYYISDILGSYK